MNNKELRKDMPTISQICEHWDKPNNNCWYCNKNGKPQRAHIVDMCSGGSNECSNFHLLCRVCHRISEIVKVRNLDYHKWFSKECTDENKELEIIRRGFEDLTSYKSNHTKLALEQLRKRGKKSSCSAPYGYKHVGDNVVKCAEEQKIIAYIKRLRKRINKKTKRVYTIRAITGILDKKGYHNRAGNPFHETNIGNIIKNFKKRVIVNNPS